MANIQLLELRPAENPIEDLSYKVTDTIFGGTCEGNGRGDDYVYRGDKYFYVGDGGYLYFKKGILAILGRLCDCL